MPKRLRKQLASILFILQINLSFFLPFSPFISPSFAADAPAVRLDFNQDMNSLSVATDPDQELDYAYYYLHEGVVQAAQGELFADSEDVLFVGIQSDEDFIKHDFSKLVFKVGSGSDQLSLRAVKQDGELEVIEQAGADGMELSAEEQEWLNWSVDQSAKSAETEGPVQQDQEYVFPLNDKVSVKFTRLPEDPSKLKIREVKLSEAAAAKLGTDVGYDITTDMADGEFEFDLSLPKPDGMEDDQVEVMHAEDETELEAKVDQAERVEKEVDGEERVAVEGDRVKVRKLDHMTVFVVTMETPASGADYCVDNTSDPASDCFNSIQEAIAQAGDGTTIMIEDGEYHEGQLSIHNKSLEIIGESKEGVVIKRNNGSSYFLSVYGSNSESIRLSNVTLDAEGSDTTNFVAHISHIANATIEDIVLKGQGKDYTTDGGPYYYNDSSDTNVVGGLDFNSVGSISISNSQVKNVSRNGFSFTNISGTVSVNDSKSINCGHSDSSGWAGLAAYNVADFQVDGGEIKHSQIGMNLTVSSGNISNISFSENNHQLIDNGNVFDLGDIIAQNNFDKAVIISDSASPIPVIFSSIQEAIDYTDPGDTVEVAAGTYEEGVTINEWLTLEGAGSDSDGTVITNSPSNGIIVTQGGNSETERLIIKNLRVENTGAHGIKLTGSSGNHLIEHVTLENVSLVNNTVHYGLWAHALNDVKLIDCDMSNNEKYGVAAGPVNNFDVINCEMNNNGRVGLYLEAHGGVNQDVTIQGGSYNNNGMLEANWGSGIYLFDSANNVSIEGVEAIGNFRGDGKGMGLQLSAYNPGSLIQNIEISNSTLQDNERGVAIWHGDGQVDGVNISGGTIAGSKVWGVHLGKWPLNSTGSLASIAVNGVSFQNNEIQVEDEFDTGAINLEDTLSNNSFDRSVVVRENPIKVPAIYSSIQDAVDAADPGDIVEVGDGNYDEAVIVDVSDLIINGPNKGVDPNKQARSDEAVIRPTTQNNWPNVGAVSVRSDGVTLDGFEIDASQGSKNGVNVYGASGATVKNNIVHGATTAWDGVGVIVWDWSSSYSVDNATIKNNKIYDTGRMGIFCMDYDTSNEEYDLTEGHEIEENVIYDTWQVAWEDSGGGIQINAGKDSLVINNTVYDTGNGSRGIYMFGSGSGNEIKGNVVRNNEIGIGLWISGEGGSPIDWEGSSPNSPEVWNNSIHNNETYGAASTNKTGADMVMDAKRNWWGDANGPKHSSNPSGTGDSVSNNVTYCPWLDDAGQPAGYCISDMDFGYNGQSGTIGSCSYFTNDISEDGKAEQILQFTSIEDTDHYQIQGYKWNGSAWQNHGTPYNPQDYAGSHPNVDFSDDGDVVTYSTGATHEGSYTYQVKAFAADDTLLGKTADIDRSDYDAACKFVVDRTSPEVVWIDPSDGDLTSGEIELTATCDGGATESQYVNFWWWKEVEGQVQKVDGDKTNGDDDAFENHQYHYVRRSDPNGGTVSGNTYSWTLDTTDDSLKSPNYDWEGEWKFKAACKDAANNYSQAEINAVVSNTNPTLPGSYGWTSSDTVPADYQGDGVELNNFVSCGQILSDASGARYGGVWGEADTGAAGIDKYQRQFVYIDAAGQIRKWGPTDQGSTNFTGLVMTPHAGSDWNGGEGTYYTLVRVIDNLGRPSIEDGTWNNWHDNYTGSCSMIIDVTPPTLSLPADITVEADDPANPQAGAVVNFSVTADDNLDDSPSLACDWSSGDTFPLGTTTVTCTSEDHGGLTTTDSFDVTVQDTTPPTVTITSPNTSDWQQKTIPLQAECSEECDYVNFWWRNVDSGENFDDYRYHKVNDNGTIFGWDLDTQNAELAQGNGTADPADDYYELPDGNYQLYAAAKDINGNWARSAAVDFRVDNNAPTAPTDIYFTDSQGNRVDCGDDVNDNEVAMHWTAASDGTGSGLAHYNYSVLRTELNGDTNLWQSPIGAGLTSKDFTFNNIEGTRDITFNAEDVAGMTSPSSTCHLNFDPTQPSSTITIPRDGENNSVIYSNSWNGEISGTSSDSNSGVSHVLLSIQRDSDNNFWDGSSWVAGTEESVRVTANNIDPWDYDLGSPAQDTYTIISHAVDHAGNVEDSYQVTVVLDKTIPQIELTTDPYPADGDGGWFITRPTITLTATDPSNSGLDYIQYQWDSPDGSWETVVDSTVSIQPESEGSHRLYYRAVDLAGNESTVDETSETGIKTINWDATELDDTDLDVSVSPNPTSDDEAVVSWDDAADNIGIDHYQVEWDWLDGDADHSKTVGGSVNETEIDDLQEGQYRVRVIAYDHAGHSRDDETTLTVDRTGPAAPTLSLDGTGTGTVDLSWNAVDDADRYLIFYGTVSGDYDYAADVGDVTSFTVEGLTAGTYYFVVRAVDDVDNQSADSNEVNTGAITGAPGAAGGPAAGFEEAGEVAGAQTEQEEEADSEGAQQSAANEPEGQVKGAAASCPPLKVNLLWIVLAVQLMSLLAIEIKYRRSRSGAKHVVSIGLTLVSIAVFYLLRECSCYPEQSLSSTLCSWYWLAALALALFVKVLGYGFIETVEPKEH